VNINRRCFFKFGSIAAATLAGVGTATGKEPELFKGSISLKEGGSDYSPDTGAARQKVPSACWQCVSRCSNMGFVEDGRLKRIEGNPKAIRNRGKLCAKGQAGINQLYDPDRILYPMKRTGARGEGKWKRISWEEALNELTARLKKLKDAGTPEKFMFHYGRMKGSDSAIVKSNFLPLYGTKTLGNHTAICETAKWVAQELTWGKHYDVNDMNHTKMILNFGCNLFETHTSHIQIAQRTNEAITERGVKLVTFDIRLSNTASKSAEWVPIKPATDGAVVLAMTNVVLKEGLYDKEFIENWTNVTVDQLKQHYKSFTPEWAEKISGVSADKITSLAIEFASTKPATIVSYRGAVGNYNGVNTERAIKTLDAICGNIDVKGGTCHGVGAKWKYRKPKGTHPVGLKISDGLKGDALVPTHHISHRTLKAIKEGSHGRPDIYMVYCYEAVYGNGECQENIDILKNEELIPYLVVVNPFYSETTALADLILPDVTYLERWSWDNMVCYEMIPEFYIRQPMVKPLGESRQLQDVFCDVAKRLDIDMGFSSSEEFIRETCKKSKIDFDYMIENGVWHDEKAKPKYKQYAKAVSQAVYEAENVLYDEATGVYWNWTKSKAKTQEEAIEKGYAATKYGYKGYVAQRFNHGVFAGFKPDKLNKTGFFEISSTILKAKGAEPFPTYELQDKHQNMKKEEFILTTYKVNVQIHSRSANCKWLSEIYHNNPAWINPVRAQRLGLSDGDSIIVKSNIGEIKTKVKVTEAVHPDAISISHHCGHWHYGKVASGNPAPTGRKADTDDEHIWWEERGMHPNWIMPNTPDPIAGQLLFSDAVVTVSKA